jgi:hypothetical protein
MRPVPSSRLFRLAARRRSLALLLAAAIVLGAAMLPAMATMSDHGHSVIAFEAAGSVAKAEEILAEWGEPGETAMWWQLAIDVPFLCAYGLLLAGLCTAVRVRVEARGSERLTWALSLGAWLAILAAAADLTQNVSLAIVLAGEVAQPWPAISAIAFFVITASAIASLALAATGFLATRGAPDSGVEGEEEEGREDDHVDPSLLQGGAAGDQGQ